MPRKSYSTAPKKGKSKPRLEWRVVTTTAAMLIAELQALTDEGWRVFAVTSHNSELLVSAYLSSWGAKADDDAPSGDSE